MIILRSDGSWIQFDAAIDDSESPTWATTDHDVEGEAFTDHKRRNPRVFTVRAVVSATPIRTSADALGTRSGDARILAAREFLTACAADPYVTVERSSGERVERVTVIGFPHKWTIEGQVTFDVSFKEIKIARSSTVKIPARNTTPRAASKRPVGTQAPDDDTDAVAADDKSKLVQLLEFAGVF